MDDHTCLGLRRESDSGIEAIIRASTWSVFIFRRLRLFRQRFVCREEDIGGQVIIKKKSSRVVDVMFGHLKPYLHFALRGEALPAFLH